MKQEFLASLVCPDCGSDFELESVYTRTETEILNAISRCRCGEYPVINGILIYKRPSSQDGLSGPGYIIERLRLRRVNEAIALPLKATNGEKILFNLHTFLTSLVGKRRAFNPILGRIRSSRRRTLRKISGSRSFFDIINRLEPNPWGAYLRHRFSSQTFWSCHPFISLIEKKNQKVLDLGCGAGHLSFVLSKHMNPENLVCADANYTLLFLAKRFMAPKANFVCLDANNPLPFKDDIFSSIIMMDSLHYISNRVLVAQELTRMLSSESLMVQFHLHNALEKNFSPGYVMPPESWKGLFPDSNPYVLPETPLLLDFVNKSEMDLTKNYTDDTINRDNALIMVVIKDEKLIDKYTNLHSYLEKHMHNPIINPMYEMHRRNGKIVLERKIPNKMFAQEYPLTVSFMPRRYTIPKDISKSITGHKIGKLNEAARNSGTFADMIRKFIVIDAPRGYV